MACYEDLRTLCAAVCKERDELKRKLEKYEKAAADVAPVVHGRWEHLEDGWFDLWRCTICGDEWTFGYDPTSTDTKVNYCPNCGARMDGGNEDG